MEIIQKESNEIRNKYLNTFVNKHSDYYKNYIEQTKYFSDGYAYTGYLWDCFKVISIIDTGVCEDILKDKTDLYVFWDIHSCERVCGERYWKYPKDNILSLSYEELKNEVGNLPEDIYVFDKSFSWSIAFTHETDTENAPWIYFTQTIDKFYNNLGQPYVEDIAEAVYFTTTRENTVCNPLCYIPSKKIYAVLPLENINLKIPFKFRYDTLKGSCTIIY